MNASNDGALPENGGFALTWPRMTRSLQQADEELAAHVHAARWGEALAVANDILAAAPTALDPRFVLADIYAKAGHVDHAVHLYRLLAERMSAGGLPLRAVIAHKALERLGSPDPQLVRAWAERYAATSPALAKVASRPGAPDPDTAVPHLDPSATTDEAAQAAFARACDPSGLPEPAAHVAALPLLSELSAPALAAVHEAFEVMAVPPSTRLIDQGQPGDGVFFVASGQVVVFSTSAEEGHKEIARVSEGTLLGEMALVSAEPRTASVVAATAVYALRLGRDALARVGQQEPGVLAVLDRFARERLLRNLVATSPLFTPFSQDQRQQLLTRFHGVEYAAGATLLEEGLPGTGLFIVLMGQVEVASLVADRAVPLARLHSGDVFGEMSLLGGGLTSARVTAVTPVTVLFLPKDDFNALIEGVPALLAHFATLANQRAAAQSVVLGRSGDLQGPDDVLL